MASRTGHVVRTVTLVSSLVLALGSGRLFAQARNIRFDRLSLEHGLSQAAINCITQDRRGFMWFGTEDGLNRYDGYSFTVFKSDPQDPSSLSDRFVLSIFEDHEGSLWVGTRGGLNRFDPVTETFRRFRNDPSDPGSLSHDRVTAIYEDRNGAVWIGTEDGLNKLDRESSSFERFTHSPALPGSLSDNRITAIFEDDTKDLWVGTRGGGLNRLDARGRTFTHYRHDARDPASLGDDAVAAVYQDREDVLWVGTFDGGLSAFDRVTGRFSRFAHDPRNDSSLSSNRVSVILQDTQGVLWVGTERGLDAGTGAPGRFSHHRNHPADPKSLSDDLVTALFEDRGGVLWVGTTVGLNKWNTATDRFPSFRAEGSDSSLSHKMVTSFASDRANQLWIGTLGGLNLLDRASGSFTHYMHEPGSPKSLSADRVVSLLVDRQDVLWVGTLTGGLDRRSGAGFRHYRHDPKNPRSLGESAVAALLEDKEGNLWVGTVRAGLSRLDRAAGDFVHYRHDPARPESLSDDRIQVLYQDSGGSLWIGTEGGGLNRWDPRSGTFRSYRQDPGDPESLTSNTIYSIQEDKSGVLWIGTDAGLNGWRRAEREAGRARFEKYQEREGIPNDVVYGILPDDGGNLWLSTNKGVSKFDPRLKRFKNYTTTDGLQSNEFNLGAAHRSPRGEMFFGGVNGFNAFYPDRIRDNAHVPPVVLTGLWKLGQKVEFEKPLWETRGIDLNYWDYVVSFEFAALDYTSPDENRYSYKLEGFDQDWIDLGTLRRATYTNLDPGSYVLRVKGSNNDGVRNEEGAALRVRVLPPPWRTWWAYSSYVLSLFGVVFSYTRAQRKKFEHEAEYRRKLEREVHARTQELQAQSIELQARSQELARRAEELQVVNQKLEEATLTDSMTGLRNRRYLMTHIHADLALVERQYREIHDAIKDSTPDFLFLMIDLDGFKQVNDVYGHSAGDRVLLQMRELLEKACRKSDTLIRWGGDEFMVVGRSVDRKCAEIVAERIRDTVADHAFDLGQGARVHLGCSIGFTLYPFLLAAPTAVKGEQVMTIADRALYVAKASGRNAWVGLFGTPTTPQADVVELVNRRLEAMLSEGTIEIVTSMVDRAKLVLEGGGRTKAALAAVR